MYQLRRLTELRDSDVVNAWEFDDEKNEESGDRQWQITLAIIAFTIAPIGAITGTSLTCQGEDYEQMATIQFWWQSN
ncbi:MAG: hypothetical protein ACRDSZ_03465 [Pseudonocardiaceae bacterium]